MSGEEENKKNWDKILRAYVDAELKQKIELKACVDNILVNIVDKIGKVRWWAASTGKVHTDIVLEKQVEKALPLVENIEKMYREKKPAQADTFYKQKARTL
eukprot:scaffold4813_cov283-Ochromonas_danica.AAC.1